MGGLPIWRFTPSAVWKSGQQWFTHRLPTVYLFSATPDNLPVSLGLLLANSLVPSWQAPDTLGELATHSWRVPNRIVRTPARWIDLTLANSDCHIIFVVVNPISINF
ncbi:hypothetical protein BHM03_00030595 [Ensete ventricosum]|nr:hypothetical protein BHM03_00030595 [Ensete ventricosum]